MSLDDIEEGDTIKMGLAEQPVIKRGVDEHGNDYIITDKDGMVGVHRKVDGEWEHSWADINQFSLSETD